MTSNPSLPSPLPLPPPPVPQQHLRLSPSNSPFYKSPIPRSPTKAARQEEPGLHLRKVIGTTTASSHAFSAAAGRFAFTAGAAAVVATVDPHLNLTQHFFRANPTSSLGSRDGSVAWTSSPVPGEPRTRTLGSLKEQTVATSPVSSSARDWLDSPGRSTSAKDRVKAATSVALSPNGKWLAVGESGYRPRILLFSAKDGSSETPLYAMAEHAFAVHALSFSPDSKFLASLGTVNDGFLFVWSVDDRTGSATLVASNKCTTLIHSMIWMGRSILTVGLRYVKIWRLDEDLASDLRTPESSRGATLTTPRNKESRFSDFGNSILSPRHRTLAGKNCLLGELLEACFTCAVAVSSSKAIFCAETGEVCLFEDGDKTLTLTVATNCGFRVTAAHIDDDGLLHTAGASGDAASFTVSELEKLAGVSAKARRQSGLVQRLPAPSVTTVAAIASVGNAAVEIDSNRVIRISDLGADAGNRVAACARKLTAHEGAVLGVQAIISSVVPNATFFTFSVDGSVHFWNREGVSVTEGVTVPIPDSPEMYGIPNELKAVALLTDGALIASGDKYGTLTVTDLSLRRVLCQVRAHSAEVLDMLAFERDGNQYLASASRDRTMQLFVWRNRRLELLQTMDEHAGAVTGLLMSQDGEYLLSCSADRSIVVREPMLRDQDDTTVVAFALLRVITLKASPSSMCLAAQDDTILVSTIDRCITKYSTKTGQPGFSFKCSDGDGGEAVVISKLLFAPSLNGNPTIAGVSSSDKSVRLYTEYGSLLARDWGHTEGITDIAIVPAQAKRAKQTSQSPQVVTVAADSTIFLWDSIISRARSPGASASSVDDGETQVHSAPTLLPPLRKVMSFSEISRLRRERSMEDRDPPSPSVTIVAAQTASPQKIRKKTSRMSLAQTPRLDSAFRPNFDATRRRSFLQRSPSPPSPRNAGKKDRRSLGMSLRSKSTENILSTSAAANGNPTGFGSLTASTESACRTLRAYRKKLVTSSSSSSSTTADKIRPEVLRELEKELKLTVRVVTEKLTGANVMDEVVMTRLLDQASDKIVNLLDEKIRFRVEDEVRRNGGESGALTPSTELEQILEHVERTDTVPGTSEHASTAESR